MNVGPLEIIIVIVLILLVFGARKLPELGNSLGQSIRGFGKGISGDADDDEPDRVEARAEQPAPAKSEQPAAAKAEERDRAAPEGDPEVSPERRSG